MKYTNEAGLPDAIVQAVMNDDYDAGRKSDISCTALIGQPRIRQLSKANSGTLTEDVSDRIYALMGQAIHSILERAEPSAIVEKRLYMEVGGWVLSGQFDRLHVDTGTLADYKIASVWEYIYGLKPERVAQLNVLAELCEQNGYSIERLQVVMIFRDWKKSEAKYKSAEDYPQKQVAVIDVPLWSKDERVAYIKERVRIHQEAETNLPECTADERWAKPDSWAVKKKGRKSALRVLSSEFEAKEWMKENGGDSIEYRQGVSTRCDSYCPVSEYCEQYKKISGRSSHSHS